MRNAHSAIVACISSLVLLSGAHPGPPKEGGPNGIDPQKSAAANSATTTVFVVTTAEETSLSTTIPITQTTTVSYIQPSSPVSEQSTSPTLSTSTSSNILLTDGHTGSTSISSPSSNSVPSTSMSSSGSSVSGNNSDSHRNLIIILSAVLGFVGILLVLSTVFLIVRYRRGQSPFTHRGASPINDEEIASWRKTSHEHKPALSLTYPPAVHDANTIGLAQSPGWSWTPPPPSTMQPIMSQRASLQGTPSFLARAPNSRAGLTDETVPGAVPFIPVPKRQSSRLSKPPPGHARTKSRRSSISAKSMWSYKEPSMDLKSIERSPTWFDPEDNNIGRELRDFDHNSSSPGTSIFDGLSAGGLSPRPKSRPRLWESDKDNYRYES